MSAPPPPSLTAGQGDTVVCNWLRWGGLLLAVAGAAFRAVTTISPFPAWELDPLVIASPAAGLGPGGSMLIDSLILLGAGLGLVGEWLSGRRVSLGASVLASIGTACILIHSTAGLGAQWIGLSWVAAIWLGVLVSHAGRDPALRRVMLATMAGFIAALAIKGAHQLLIDHPETVREFARNRASIFEAQGWTADSPMAKAYERRLMQPEATGWFGLANVYASFAAAGSVLLMGLCAASWVKVGCAPESEGKRTGPLRAERALVSVGFVLALAAAGMAGSKGGFVAVLLGVIVGAMLFVVGTGRFRQRLRDARVLGGMVGPLAILATYLLVILRGLVGERIGELSLLFRWFYVQAAARIAGEYPLFGVGPDGFQRAYLLAKSPLNPEEVSSPHNVLMEWWATLGLFGLAWAALLVWWAWSAGERAVEPSAEVETQTVGGRRDRNETRWVAGVAAIAVVGATRLDSAIMTVDSMLARVLGLVLWCAIGWGVLRLLRRSGGTAARLCRTGLGGAAIALACHGMIDVTATWPNSAAMFMLIIAGAGTLDPSKSPRRASTRALPGLLPGLACCALAAWAMVAWARPALKWETDLKLAAAEVNPIAEIGGKWRELSESPPRSNTDFAGALKDMASSLSNLLGHPVEPAPTSIVSALAQMDLILIPRAEGRLRAAADRYPDQWKIWREISRLHLRSASLYWSRGQQDQAREEFEKAVETVTPKRGATGVATAWGALGFVYETQANVTGEPRSFSRAVVAWEEAAALDPYALEYAVRLMRANQALGRVDQVRVWARRVLDLDALQRLDREVRGLNQADRGAALTVLENP